MARLSKDYDEGKLNNDAMIYQKRDDNNSKEEYEKLDKKGKFQFFKDYYLKNALLIILAVAVGGYYLAEAMTKPQNALYIAIADEVLDEDQVEKLEDAIETYLSVDGKRQVVEINTNFSHTNGELSRQLQSYIYAGSCDIVIAPEEGFRSWAQAGYFLEPETSDKVAFYKEQPQKNRIYTRVIDGEQVRGEKPEDDTEYNFGVSVRNTQKYKALKGICETAYAGIPNSSKHQDEAAAVIQYLLDDHLKDGAVDPDFAAVEPE